MYCMIMYDMTDDRAVCGIVGFPDAGMLQDGHFK